ncbi:MAG TPA: 4Fe-4S dicluster domain-containing protein [Candidatus Marinimicrobia bacterium]|nr:4Fe-4S dicluster domain-containing protein [Candidatus Neomarinimicrobiota bacterium]
MIQIDDNRCDLCGACVGICPADAIAMSELKLRIDPDTCINCDLCVIVCPFNALEAEHEASKV